jgi:hypothetical protein
MTNQPTWRTIANLGDVNPLDHGGYFVMIDQTGQYQAEAELLVVPEHDDDSELYMVYRFILDPCTYDKETDTLSDNCYHPLHSAWFAKSESERAERPQDDTYLQDVCDSCDIKKQALIELFLSHNVVKRAEVYHMIGDYHGWDNLDADPLRLTREEAEQRLAKHHGEIS